MTIIKETIVEEFLRRRIHKLETALKEIPFGTYGEAIADGLDSVAAYSEFVEACDRHTIKALEEDEFYRDKTTSLE